MRSVEEREVKVDVEADPQLPPLQENHIGSLSSNTRDKKDLDSTESRNTKEYQHVKREMHSMISFYWPDLESFEAELSKRRKTTLDIFTGVPKPEGYNKDEDRHYSVLTDDWRAYCRCNCGGCCKFASYVLFFPFTAPFIRFPEVSYQIHGIVIGLVVLLWYVQFAITMILVRENGREEELGLMAMAFLNALLLVLDTSVEYGDNRVYDTITPVTRGDRKRSVVNLPLFKSLLQIVDIRPDGNSNIQKRARLAEMDIRLDLVNCSDHYIQERAEKMTLLDYDCDPNVNEILGPHKTLGDSYKKQLLEKKSVSVAATADQVIYGIHYMDSKCWRLYFRECACDCSMDCIHVTYLMVLLVFFTSHFLAAVLVPILILADVEDEKQSACLFLYTANALVSAPHFVQFQYRFVNVYRAEYTRMRTISTLMVPGVSERYLLPRLNFEAYDHILAWASIRDYVKLYGLPYTYYFGIRFIYFGIYFALCFGFALSFFITNINLPILAILTFNAVITTIIGVTCVLLYGVMANGELEYHRRTLADRILKREQHQWIRASKKAKSLRGKDQGWVGEDQKTGAEKTPLIDQKDNSLRNRKKKEAVWPEWETKHVRDNGVSPIERGNTGDLLETVHYTVKTVNETTPVKLLCTSLSGSLLSFFLTFLVPIVVILLPLMWWVIFEVYRDAKIHLRVIGNNNS